MHLVSRFSPNFGYAPPQNLKIIYIFRKMMDYSCLVLVVLLSHHSLGLVSFSSSSSSLFGIDPFVCQICVVDVNYFILLVAHKNFPSRDVITVIFIHT